VLDTAFFAFYARSRVLTDPKTGEKTSLLPPWLREALRIYSEEEVRDFLAGKAEPTRV
jgi:hypothetical protein